MTIKSLEKKVIKCRQCERLVNFREKIAIEKKPKLIIAGGSAYSRVIDFKRFREIADKVGAYLMVDMAHFSGLVAGKGYPNPIDFAHVVTSTTHGDGSYAVQGLYKDGELQGIFMMFVDYDRMEIELVADEDYDEEDW